MQADQRELVVLVHGMGRSRLSMLLMAHSLKRAGFRVRNWGYSSFRFSLAELGQALQADVQKNRGAAPRIHFVGHSLGGIIIRWALTEGNLPAGAGRVVMLAPPNLGARRADRASRWVAGLLKPLPEIRTGADSTVRGLSVPAGIEVGVIAGRRDGKVAVAETHLTGEVDHIVVPSAHTFIMLRPDVRRLTVAFLRHGQFAGPAGGADR